MERVLDECFPEFLSSLWNYLSFSFVFSGNSGEASWKGESRRLRSAHATRRAPPSLIEGRTWLAIQRLTVRGDIPVSSAMSAARRYSFGALTFLTPVVKERSAGVQPLWSSRAIREPPAEQAAASAVSARRKPPDRRVLDHLCEQRS
jgi:hypothetical protein